MKEIKTYIIQNKITKQQWKASSGKIAWKKVNHAKAAFANTYNYYTRTSLPIELQPYFQANKYKDKGTLYFDQQDIYEIVEVKSDVRVFTDKIVSLLESIEGNGFVVSDPDGDLIEQYIKEWRG